MRRNCYQVELNGVYAGWKGKKNWSLNVVRKEMAKRGWETKSQDADFVCLL